MTLVLLLAIAGADIETPLGRYARPGVPVLLRSSAPTVVDLDGWKFRLDGTTPVFPPAVPCVVRDEEGRELLRLEDPGERALTGVIGDVPPGLADAVMVKDAVALAAGCWRALDLFDRVLVAVPLRGDEAWFPCVARWVHAGGSLAGPDAVRLFPSAGLGAVAPRLEDLPPPRIPRPGNVRPDVYAVIGGRIAATSPALRATRWIVLGAALASAVLLALCRRVRAGPLLLGLAAVSVVGAAVGLARTRADYTPVARWRIVISYFGKGVERRRTYLVYGHAGKGAVAPRAPEAAPILFGPNREPWWRGAGGEAELQKDVTRVFLVEEILDAPPPPLFPNRGRPRIFWARERPRGEARVTASPVSPPEAVRSAPLLLEVRAVVQD